MRRIIRRLRLAIDDLALGYVAAVIAAAVCVETELAMADGYLFFQRARSGFADVV